MQIGEIIKNARKKKGLSQRDLARKIGVKHNSISNWENNQNLPNGSTLYVLMQVLNIEFEELFGDDVDFNKLESMRINDPSELTKIQRLMLDVGDAQIVELLGEKRNEADTQKRSGFNLSELIDKNEIVKSKNTFNIVDLFTKNDLQNPLDENQLYMLVNTLIYELNSDVKVRNFIKSFMTLDSEDKAFVMQTLENLQQKSKYNSNPNEIE